MKIIKHNTTCEICNNYGDVKFREHLVHENRNKQFTDEEFHMIETLQLSEIRKRLETVRKTKMLERMKIVKHNATCEICKNYGNVKF